MTLKERMALLNAAHVGRAPIDFPATVRPQAQIPERRPTTVTKQKSFNLPSENTISTAAQPPVANLPRGLPPPLPTRRVPPPLPVRRSSQDPGFRESTDSVKANGYNSPRVVATRTKSEEQGSRIKAPAWGECELPPLPVKVDPKTRTRSVTHRPPPVNRTSSVSSLASTISNASNGSRQTLPPPLPGRKESADGVPGDSCRKLPPIPSAEVLEKAKKASFNGEGDSPEKSAPAPPLPARRPSTNPSLMEQVRQSVDASNITESPPPIPQASRPDLSAIQSTKPKVNGVRQRVVPSSGCLICRDFSAPDHHATLFPRQQVTSIQTLAHQLTAPFPSATDKARAIFTWLHHNIDYNTQAFFSGNVRASTPQSTLQTGLAVCEGYAALFANLATYAGLESMVISGHGKGFGFQALAPGAPLPPYEGNHAWNVVKIDEGWKLIDSCWGSGAVQGANMPYIRRFAPERFTQSNEEFGLDHFPNNRDHFFLPDGRTLTWEEYIQRNSTQWPYQFEPLTVFTNATTDYSIGQQTFTPPYRKIEVYKQETLRVQFGLFCPHWTHERHSKQGPPPVFILAAGGVDGRNKHFIPLEHIRAKPPGSGGDMWYVDVNPRELGAPGETLTMFAVRSFGDREDARGLTVREFKEGVGRVGMGFTGVAAWELI